jgi:hypothetical protein
MKTFYAVLASTVALALGASAVNAAADSNNRTGFMTGNDCFFARSITDWRPLDNRNLVVFTGIRRPYHVQLSMPANELRFQDSIAFTDRDGRICSHGGDSVVVNGAIPERISIAAIRRLTEGQLEELYLSFGVKRPTVIETPETPSAED